MKGIKKETMHESDVGSMGVSRRSFIRKTLGLSALCLSCDVSGLLEGLPSAYAGSHEHIPVSLPQDVAVGARGTLYVTSISEEGSYRVIAIDESGKQIGSFGKTGSGPGELNFPQGIAVDDSGEIYVVERNNGRISVFDGGGSFKRIISALGLIYGRTYSPEGIYLTHDSIFLADTRNHRIQLFDKHGEVQRVIGEMGDRDDQFRLPTGLAVSSDELLYVVDSKHNYIKVFSVEGKFIKKFGGTSTKERERGLFNQPTGISLDEEKDRVYVSDTMNNRIQVFDLEGNSTGILDEAKGYYFTRPKGVGLDGEGTLVIADTANNRVHRIARDELI